jgi:hypothetical protein
MCSPRAGIVYMGSPCPPGPPVSVIVAWEQNRDPGSEKAVSIERPKTTVLHDRRNAIDAQADVLLQRDGAQSGADSRWH